MGLFRKKHDITDIYGVKSMKESPFTRKGEEEEPGSSRRHSDYYHRYFRGYTEIRKLNPKGRVRVERYYVRPWIVSGLSTGKYWLVRLLYACLAVVSSVLFAAALLQRIPSNYSMIVALPGYISVVLLFLLLVSTAGYIFAPKKMTLWDHTSSTTRLKRFSLAAGLCQLLTALTTTGYLLYYRIFVSETLQSILVMLAAVVCSAAIHIVERKVPYTEIPNETKLPAGEAHEIW